MWMKYFVPLTQRKDWDSQWVLDCVKTSNNNLHLNLLLFAFFCYFCTVASMGFSLYYPSLSNVATNFWIVGLWAVLFASTVLCIVDIIIYFSLRCYYGDMKRSDNLDNAAYQVAPAFMCIDSWIDVRMKSSRLLNFVCISLIVGFLFFKERFFLMSFLFGIECVAFVFRVITWELCLKSAKEFGNSWVD